jgi:hypothetical protein
MRLFANAIRYITGHLGGFGNPQAAAAKRLYKNSGVRYSERRYLRLFVPET